MATNLRNVVIAAGLPELAEMDQLEIAADFMPAAVTGLADGDLFLLHEEYSGKKAELYGDSNYGAGRVARAIGDTAIRNGMEKTDIYGFQAFAASYYHEPGSPFAVHNPTSAISISLYTVSVDNQATPLSRPPGLVVDFGACLTSRSIIGDQLKFVQYGVRPFAYAPLTRTHFMNRSLMLDYDRRAGQGTASLMIDHHLYIGREDGISSATAEILSSQGMHNAPTEVADVILCTHGQHATADELLAGLGNAHQILKDDGLLVIRGLTHPASDEIGAEQMAAKAYDSGFDESKSEQFETAMENIGSLILSGHFGEREMRTIILKK